MQALGSRYIYNSDYFEETREMQVYLSGVDGSLKRDSLLAIYVLDAQYPPTFNLFVQHSSWHIPTYPVLLLEYLIQTGKVSWPRLSQIPYR